jgi:hypothetical protein
MLIDFWLSKNINLIDYYKPLFLDIVEWSSVYLSPKTEQLKALSSMILTAGDIS